MFYWLSQLSDAIGPLNVYRYILAHAAQGAWTWTMVGSLAAMTAPTGPQLVKS